MKIARAVGAGLLAVCLLVFGGNYFVHFFELPEGDGLEGDQLLQAMRDGGLMGAVAFSHIVAGVLLLIPTLRFLGGLLQLPMTLGIVAFHATMLPAGLPMAGVMLVLNLLALWEPNKWKVVSSA